ncbi:hypothetical protein [Rhizorhabdus argentea]|uniref:hypothetical protein n=1 Tax=Rhizorhabdus argentea TaxID=1387174 RepID=UPI0030EE1F42
MSHVAARPLALECDLVMKGGVTSGIIYPGAIAAIARDYRLRAIGGTSAGAIGAAAAAAMEFGRRSGRNADAPAMMASLASRLGAPSDGRPLLLRLFEPDASTARLFRLLMRISEARRRGAGAVLRLFLLVPAMVALLVAGATVGVLVWRLPEPRAAAGIALAIVSLLCTTVVLTALFAAAYWLPRVKAGLAATANNGFGFCSGMARYKTPVPRWRWPWQRRPTAVVAPSLSEWLHEQFQALAGLGKDEILCFGDLWAAAHRLTGRSRETAFAAAMEQDAADAARERVVQEGATASSLVPRLDGIARDIELALVASDINRAQSVQLPFMRREDRLYARISDLRALFPEAVVIWMIDHRRTSAEIDAELEALVPDAAARADFIRLPRPQDLPVLIAVRMSLSFPFLFRAVRLYVVRRNGQARGCQELAEIWLADGGITSNFPIHLFDAPIPGRPTFCLNLLYHDDELEPDDAPKPNVRSDDGDPAQEDPAAPAGDTGLPTIPAEGGSAEPDDLVYMLRTNSSRLSAYTRFTPGAAFGRLVRFGGRVLTTARQWGDNQLIDIPGYRDRIVHIRMLPDEGGFNFDMGKDRIDLLQARGARAGTVIATRFRPDITDDPLHPGERLVLGWANHRFVRFRSFLAGLEVAASRFSTTWIQDRNRAEYPSNDPQYIYPSIEQMTDGARSGDTALPRTGYPFRNAEQADLAHEMVKACMTLHTLAGNPAWRGIDFVNGRATSPRPKTVLKLRPPNETDVLAERP